MANPKVEVRKLRSGEIGETGTYIFSGYITGEEYNKDLIGQQSLTVYDKMRRSDATVRASLLAVFLPILEANWNIKPAGDDPKDQEVAAFAKESLFQRLEIPWIDTLRQILLYLVYGRMVFEKVFMLDEEGNIRWKKFAPRLPRTITKWEMEGGKAGIHQDTATGKSVDIPMDKLIIFVNEKEGDNWEGISILRSAYIHWYMKQNLYKIEAMAIERQGLGIPVITVPANATKDDEAKAEEIAKNMRANEKSFAKLREGWSIEILDMKGTSTKQVQPAILHHDRQIVKNVMAQFFEIGAGSNAGGYSQSKDQSRLFLLSLSSIVKTIKSVLQPVINELVDYNFTVEKYPTLEADGLGEVDFNEVSQAIQRFSQSGMLTPTDATEDYIRHLLDFPEITEEERAEIDLNKFLDNIDKQNAPQPQVPFGAKSSPFMQKPLQAAEGDKPDAKKSETKKESDKSDAPDKQPQEPNLERNVKSEELKSFVISVRQELEEMKAAGTPVTTEWVAKKKVEIMEKQKEVGEETAGMPMFADEDELEFSEDREKVADTLERINNALDTLDS